MDKPATNSQPRNALGKGLASLLPTVERNSTAAAPMAATHDNVEEKANRVPGITMVDINSIEANVYQPRRDFDESALSELAESIRSKGIIQPLIVRRGADGKFFLIAGERRLRAAKLSGLKHVPVVIRQSSDKETLEIALIENIQRENLNCVEIALSFFQLIEDFQLTQEEVSKRVGKDRASVANHVRLLKLPEEIIKDLREAKLTFGHGRALLSLKDPVEQIRIRNRVVEQGMSVRETEILVAKILEGEEPAAAPKEGETDKQEGLEELKHVAQRIGRVYGSKVNLKGTAHKGSIVIKYFSRSDLDRIVEQLLN